MKLLGIGPASLNDRQLVSNGPALLVGSPARMTPLGLLSAYLLNEGSGQTVGDSVATYVPGATASNGTLGSTSSVETTDPAWVTAGLSFDGTNDFVTLPGATLGSAYTLMGILTPTDFAATRLLFGTDQGLAYLGMTTAGKPILTAYSTAQDAVVSATAITAGTPVCLTGVVASNVGIFLYANGVLVGSLLSSTKTFGGRTLTALGRNGLAGTLYMKGTITLPMAWCRALTAAEVRQQYFDLKVKAAARGVTLV